MDQGLSFIINDEKLYADQVLIEFEEMPVLFVCKGTHYYLALCTDPDIPAYYVTRSSVFSLLDMLQVLNFFLKCGSQCRIQLQVWFAQCDVLGLIFPLPQALRIGISLCLPRGAHL